MGGKTRNTTIQFCSNVAKQVARFCCPFYRTLCAIELFWEQCRFFYFLLMGYVMPETGSHSAVGHNTDPVVLARWLIDLLTDTAAILN